MKNLLLLLVVLSPLFVLSQKLKIKKNRVLIDKVQVGTLEKGRDSMDRKTFVYADMKGDTLIRYCYNYVGSPIEGREDDGFYYSDIQFPQLELESSIPNGDSKLLGLTRKTFLKTIFKNGYINADGSLVEDKVKEDFPQQPIPVNVIKLLEKENAEKLDNTYVIDRDFSKHVAVVQDSQNSYRGLHYFNSGYSTFFIDLYTIRQDDIVIGKVKVLYNGTQIQSDPKEKGYNGIYRSTDPYIYFYNTKGKRVAWSHGLFHDLKVHDGNLRLDRRKTEFLEPDNVRIRIKNIARYLANNRKI